MRLLKELKASFAFAESLSTSATLVAMSVKANQQRLNRLLTMNECEWIEN